MTFRSTTTTKTSKTNKTRKARAAFTAFAVATAAGLGAAGVASADGVDPDPEIAAPPVDRFQFDPCADASGLAAAGVPPELLELLCPAGGRSGGSPGAGASRPGAGSWTSEDESAVLDSICDDVAVRTSRRGRQEQVMKDSWAGAVGEAITDWIDNGFDGEEDSKGEQTARAIISLPAWLGVIYAYGFETMYKAVTDPLSLLPQRGHTSERVGENTGDEGGDDSDETGDSGDSDDSDREREGNGGSGESSGGAGSTTGGGSSGTDGPDGASRPAPSPDGVGPGSTESGIEQHCRDKAERDRQDPHGHDESTYIETDCDDPSVNPNPAAGETEIEAGQVEEELDCHDASDEQLVPSTPSSDCGPTAQPVAGQQGCGGAVTRVPVDPDVAVAELELPVEVEICDPTVCRPVDGVEPPAAAPAP